MEGFVFELGGEATKRKRRFGNETPTPPFMTEIFSILRFLAAKIAILAPNRPLF
jgi:hypothetical protein